MSLITECYRYLFPVKSSKYDCQFVRDNPNGRFCGKSSIFKVPKKEPYPLGVDVYIRRSDLTFQKGTIIRSADGTSYEFQYYDRKRKRMVTEDLVMGTTVYDARRIPIQTEDWYHIPSDGSSAIRI